MKNEPTTDSRRAFLGFFVKAPLIPAAVLATRPAAATPTPPEREILMNDFAIAGFRYYDGPKELPRLVAGTRLTLRAEPENPHDAFAVEFFHGDAKLGYAPRFCNRHMSRLLLEGVFLACVLESADIQVVNWEGVTVLVSSVN
ncbi:MAG TPA: HIRAN domain-containing protein [Verrucomicrobiota bacterium]|nr:HIRAN domain-containing protein [Verrucomicrobiota bacterium]